MKIDRHLKFLQTQIFLHREKLPIAFEYYVAHKFTKDFGQVFFVWKDVPESLRTMYQLPARDKGVDCISDDTKTLVQCKYYSQKNTIYYNKLSTFLGFVQFFGDDCKRNLYLVRTAESRISTDVQKIINTRNLVDCTIPTQTFVQSVNKICK